ncbi:elongation factor Ts, mitochondrial-like isoform X1 [Artemia franciscana]|uniref:elongation factor Ts, mitochondrial-like isoform X1 n=1 Tax=Artemia franciscana TaxID=6661 RepID=UPI0032DB6EE6
MRNYFFVRSLGTTAKAGSNKSPLAILRKKTGYSFSNCKKALEVNENNIEKAEQWLHAQAQEQGWAKATKLQDRSTAQGLIGIAVNKERNVAAMIELNCETDFVARNARFQDLVTTITNHCLTEVMKRQTDRHMFLSLTEEELKGFLAPDGSTLADIIALNIGQIGENMKLRRGVGAFANPSVHMSCYTHPTVTGFCPSVMTGKFGALAFFKRTSEEAMPENWTMDTLGRQICQHIVGMNPSSIERKPDEKQLSPEESTVLLDQEFLVDPDVTVKEVLDACSVNVLDYVRFQCGMLFTGCKE